MYRNIVLVLCIGIVWADDTWRKRVVFLKHAVRTLDSIRQEYPCTSNGGLCTIAKDCPEGHLTEEKGLCPEQRRIGVECCYGVSVKETRCHKRGGACMAGPCGKSIQYRNATDCPKDTTCCILVQ